MLTDYDAGWNDAIREAVHRLELVADRLTNRGDEYKAGLVQECAVITRAASLAIPPPDPNQ